jgi:hypothetical protein
MQKYTSYGRKALFAESMRDAAEVFALRKARKIYGRNALVAYLTCYGESPKGTVGDWQAFIGRRSGRREITGCNVRLTVTRD